MSPGMLNIDPPQEYAATALFKYKIFQKTH